MQLLPMPLHTLTANFRHIWFRGTEKNKTSCPYSCHGLLQGQFATDTKELSCLPVTFVLTSAPQYLTPSSPISSCLHFLLSPPGPLSTWNPSLLLRLPLPHCPGQSVPSNASRVCTLAHFLRGKFILKSLSGCQFHFPVRLFLLGRQALHFVPQHIMRETRL